MLQSISAGLTNLLGLGIPGSELDFFHMAARGVLVFIVGIIGVRTVAHRRFLSRSTPFDAILGITLGAILARAVNGTAAFVPTLGSALVLLALDRLIAMGAYRWVWFRHLVEGRSRDLIRDGAPDAGEMRRLRVSREDLLRELRRQGHVDAPGGVLRACLEPGGEITVILGSETPRA